MNKIWLLGIVFLVLISSVSAETIVSENKEVYSNYDFCADGNDKVVDGDLGTIWRSCKALNSFPVQWVTINLGTPTQFHRIDWKDTNNQDGTTWDYDISGSDDNSTWTLISDNNSVNFDSNGTIWSANNESGLTYQHLKVDIVDTGTAGRGAEIYEITLIDETDEVAAVPSNESIESTATVQQIGTTTLNSPTLTTVISSDFEVEVNNTPLYGVYTLNVESNVGNQIYCEMNIAGQQGANVTRSNTGGDIGSITLTSTVQNMSAGNYTQNLQCQKSGSGTIVVSNAVGIGHFLVDEQNRTITYDSESFNVNTSSTSYTKVGTFNFTTGNLTDDTNASANHIVLEWAAQYTNNAAGTEELSTYIDINGTNCSIYPRDVSSGGSGSVSGDCIIENATNETTYVIDLYAKGSDASFSGNIIAKNFFMSHNEIVGGTGILTGQTFSGSTPQLIINVSGGNANHALANAFSKVSYSVSALAETDGYFFITLNNTQNYMSNNFERTFNTETGVVTGHDMFLSVPQDNYSIALYGVCPGTTCTIEGGASLGYITDSIDTIFNAFNVTAQNKYNSSTITSFNVTNGLTVDTTTGTLTYFTEEDLVNITIRANGFFPETILNYNTSNNLQVNLTRAYANIEIYAGLSKNPVNNFTIQGYGYNETTTNGVVTLSLIEGTYEFNVSNLIGYYNDTINFSINALDNITVNQTLYNSIINFTFNNTFSSTFIPVNWTITQNTYGYSKSGNGTFIYETIEANINYTLVASNSDMITLNTTFIAGNVTDYRTWNMTPISLWLTFNETTNVIITSLNNQTSYNNVTLFIKQSYFPIGKVTIAWNEVQIMEYYNEYSPLRAYLSVQALANETLTEQRTIRILGDNAALSDARVVAEAWNDKTGQYEIVFGRLTDTNGLAILNLELDKEYKITAQKSGYDSESVIITVRSGDTTIQTIYLEESSSETSTIVTDCIGSFTTNKTCYTKVFCDTVNCIVTLTTNTTYKNGSSIITTTSATSSTNVAFGTAVDSTMSSIKSSVEVSDGTAATFTGTVDENTIKSNEIFKFLSNQQTDDYVGIFLIGIIIVASIVAIVFEKKVLDGSGIYVFGAMMFLGAIFIPAMLIFGLIIFITKIGIVIFNRLR